MDRVSSDVTMAPGHPTKTGNVVVGRFVGGPGQEVSQTGGSSGAEGGRSPCQLIMPSPSPNLTYLLGIHQQNSVEFKETLRDQVTHNKVTAEYYLPLPG